MRIKIVPMNWKTMSERGVREYKNVTVRLKICSGYICYHIHGRHTSVYFPIRAFRLTIEDKVVRCKNFEKFAFEPEDPIIETFTY